MTESTATLLNVNDSDCIRYLITRTLVVAGYRVVESLPDISGYEVCTRPRAREETASLRVLQTSATFITPERKAQGNDEGPHAQGSLLQQAPWPALANS